MDPLVKRWVWELREREHGVHLSVPKVFEVLRERYVIRSKWKKNHLRGPVPRATAPRQVVQMDSILLGGLYAFTGIDIYTAADLPACQATVETLLERYHYHRPHLGLGLRTPLTKGV